MIDKNKLNELIGANIKRERENAGFTQEELSGKIGLEVKTLSKIERGKVGISILTLCQICQVLCVSSSVILCRPSRDVDVQGLIEQLSNLTPTQFLLVNDTIKNMLKAFDLDKYQYKPQQKERLHEEDRSLL